MDSQTRRLLEVLGNSADGVFAVDAEHRIIYWSRAAQELLGYSAVEVLGRPCYEVFRGKDEQGNRWCHQDCPVVQRMRQGRPFPSYDLQTSRKDGSPLWLNISIVPLPQGDGLPYLPVHLLREATSKKTRELLGERVLRLVQETAGAVATGAGREPEPIPLSRRQWEVLALLAQGYSTAQVASALGLRQVTVQNYLQRIFTKLGVHSRTEALAWFYRRQGAAPTTHGRPLPL